MDGRRVGLAGEDRSGHGISSVKNRVRRAVYHFFFPLARMTSFGEMFFSHSTGLPVM